MIQGDISGARAPGARNCPIALCLERHGLDAAVNDTTTIRSPDLPGPLTLELNEEALEFMDAFDNEQSIQPAPLRINLDPTVKPEGADGILEMSEDCAFTSP